MQSKNLNGYTLIEMSIVLIIVGLLVSSVTAGSKMIENAKVIRFIKDMETYKHATYIFKLMQDRLPGDFNNDGYVGRFYYSNTKKDEPAFVYHKTGSKYNGKTLGFRAGPFVELFDAKLLDFEPDINNLASTTSVNIDIKKSLYPKVNPYKNFLHSGFYTHENTTIPSTSSEYKMNGIYMWISSIDDKGLKAKLVERIDKKVDDGIHNAGKFRAGCPKESAAKTYSQAMLDNNDCTEFMYELIPLGI